MRAMVATVALSGVLAAGLAAAAVTSATAQDAEEEPPAAGSDPEALVDRLVEIERELPTELPPSQVIVDPETTFGQMEGDFVGAVTQLELVSDQARQLFIDADSADGEVAEAVALVARGYLRMEEAFTYLARFEEFDLARPVDVTDDDGVATGADTASGLVMAGVDLLDLARMDSLLGYGLLRDSEAADDAEKSLFDAAYVDTQQYLTRVRPEAHTMISASSTAVLVAVSRFEDAAVGEPRAREVTYVCVPRNLYPVDSPEPTVALAALLAGEEMNLIPTEDCPDLPSAENVVSTPIG